MKLDLYFSKDFYMSAYLICKNHALLTHERTNGLTTFGFENTPELRTDCEKYFAAQAPVDAMTYGNAVRNLKSLLHNGSLSNSNLNSTCQTIQDQPVH